LLVVETNRYYHLFLDNSDDGPFPPTWGEKKQKCLRFGLWHYRWDIQFMADWRSIGRKWKFCYGQTIRARYYDILRFLHFTDNNRNGVDRTDDRPENKRLIWNSKDELFKISQNLALDEVIIKFKEDSFQTVHTEKTQTLRHQNVQTMRL
jgi:hypothetical protein